MRAPIILETTRSTQYDALLALKNGDRGPCWILARRQSKGEGRQGREWFDAEGNFMASRFAIMDLSLNEIGPLAWIVGLALHQTLTQNIGQDHKLELKWPNDILYNGKKLSGILVQTEALSPSQLGVIIGIGINLRSSPKIDGYAVTDIMHITQKVISPMSLLEPLEQNLISFLALWKQHGFESLASEWHHIGFGRNDSVIWDCAGILKKVTIQGIDINGLLVIETQDHEVFHLTQSDIIYPHRNHV